MSEEATVDLENLHESVTAAVTTEVEEAGTDEVVYSEAEQEAIDKGWNPEGVTGKRNLSAEEFLDRESFFDEIHKLKREVRSQKQMVDALQQHNTTISEKAYEKAIKDLKSQKVQAADNEDLGAIIQIDEKIEELRDAREQGKASTQTESATPYTPQDWGNAYEDFVDKNSWYKTDRKRQVFADSIGTTYAQANPTASPDEVYSYVIKEVTKEFKEAAPAKPAAVAPAGRSGGKASAKKYKLSDIPEGDREIAKIVISSGVSEEDYLKQYFQL